MTSFTNQSKATTASTKQTKNSSSFTNQTRNTNYLWSASNQPWQLAQPWQMSGTGTINQTKN
jgi:hypothetical protein